MGSLTFSVGLVWIMAGLSGMQVQGSVEGRDQQFKDVNLSASRLGILKAGFGNYFSCS
ncbi:hypothetical protein RchiOBHm_Chr4g0419331 [Rosa chinensis]|uniref:Uncharacterized protein n=1 Tax=Rosa chinensis TaxID=74649 RepID=A0A2P6QXN2_ROSCH|nr:hypothetical protein RchiOBHm_Chr4g0419331 [Rosa chinensis]